MSCPESDLAALYAIQSLAAQVRADKLAQSMLHSPIDDIFAAVARIKPRSSYSSEPINRASPAMLRHVARVCGVGLASL